MSKKKYYKVGNVIQHTDNIDISSILTDMTNLQLQLDKLSGTESGIGLLNNFYKSNEYDFAAKSFITIEHHLGLTQEQIDKG